MAKTTKAIQSFKDAVLGRLNKSDAELQVEKITDKIEDYILECKSQISLIENSKLPESKALLSRAEREVEKAKKDLEESYYNLERSSYEYYVDNINGKAERVANLQANVDKIVREMDAFKAQLEKHKEILTRLEA